MTAGVDRHAMSCPSESSREDIRKDSRLQDKTGVSGECSMFPFAA